MRKKDPVLMEKIARFASDYRFEHHASPSIRAIAAFAGVSVSTVQTYLVAMDAQGLLHYRAKDIRPREEKKEDARVRRVPVVGRIACGGPEDAEQEIEGYVALPVALFGDDDCFILRTHGDSMIGAGIEDGDLVVVKRQNVAKSGDRVVALVNNETTLKTFRPDEKTKTIRLHPENPTMEDIVVDSCEIQGVAGYVIKRL